MIAEPLALYVHWPFCVSKCPYCDFNSHVRSGINQDAWRDALLEDLAYEAQLLPGRTLTSIFFGGGTPSLMAPRTVEAIIEAAVAHWLPVLDIEITLEANPNSVEAERFADLAHSGVNRLSLDFESFDDEALHFLGRAHSAREGFYVLETAQKRFRRVSFDLIYGLPGDTRKAGQQRSRRHSHSGPGTSRSTSSRSKPGHHLRRWRKGANLCPSMSILQLCSTS